MEADTVLADKAFDADARMIEPLAAAGKTTVIPTQEQPQKPAHLMTRSFTRPATSSRIFFCKLKQFRAIATRYDKTARNFLAGSISPQSPFGLIEHTP